MIAFVHIPKTGGTTLSAMLERQYAHDELHEIMMRGMSWIAAEPALVPKRLITLSKIHRLKSALRQARPPRMIHGHFDWSIVKLLPAGTRCFTLLRDPVERAISHYYHYRRMVGDPAYPIAMGSTLAQWVSERGLVEMDNGQTRRLAGEMGVPYGRLTARMLDRAKANLARLAVVGLTERFDESVVLLQRAFGWTLLPVRARNIGKDRPPRAAVSPQTLQLIEDCNRLDLDLYRFGRGLFERAIGKLDAAAELARQPAEPAEPYSASSIQAA
jgi:hypothetical protein